MRTVFLDSCAFIALMQIIVAARYGRLISIRGSSAILSSRLFGGWIAFTVTIVYVNHSTLDSLNEPLCLYTVTALKWYVYVLETKPFSIGTPRGWLNIHIFGIRIPRAWWCVYGFEIMSMGPHIHAGAYKIPLLVQ